MIYGSACSGIEAASAAWKNLPQWEPKWFSEIDPFCVDFLKTKYPSVPNLGPLELADETKLKDTRPTELLVAGTPCQSFSINGMQAGLGHANGILAISFLELAERIKPRWVVWENVLGVLSCNKGRDFATILRTLVKFGYGVCWRVLDAKYFGVPQTRRRVFVVGYLGDWRPAAAVLFEHSQSASIIEEREKTRPSDNSIPREKTVSIRSDGNNTENLARITLGWAGDETTKVNSELLPTLKSQQGGEGTGICTKDIVRRLSVTEYEKAMGFDAGYTELSGYSIRVRQKALGNSMAVPVMRWLGERIHAVDTILQKRGDTNMAFRRTKEELAQNLTLDQAKEKRGLKEIGMAVVSPSPIAKKIAELEEDLKILRRTQELLAQS